MTYINVVQIVVSLSTVYAYWLVTHCSWTHRKSGLWLTLFTELGWMGMFVLIEQYYLIPISVFMLYISVRRLRGR